MIENIIALEFMYLAAFDSMKRKRKEKKFKCDVNIRRFKRLIEKRSVFAA